MSSLTTFEALSKYPMRATPVWTWRQVSTEGDILCWEQGSHPKSSRNVLPPTSDFHVLFLPPRARCSAPFRSQRALHPQGPPPRPGLEGFRARDGGSRWGEGGGGLVAPGSGLTGVSRTPILPPPSQRPEDPASPGLGSVPVSRPPLLSRAPGPARAAHPLPRTPAGRHAAPRIPGMSGADFYLYFLHSGGSSGDKHLPGTATSPAPAPPGFLLPLQGRKVDGVRECVCERKRKRERARAPREGGRAGGREARPAPAALWPPPLPLPPRAR